MTLSQSILYRQHLNIFCDGEQKLFAFFQTTLPEFQKLEFLVVRQHEEFVWLHDRFEEIEEYAGYIVSTVHLYRESNLSLDRPARNLFAHASALLTAEPSLSHLMLAGISR
jgi:hypothetical protein